VSSLERALRIGLTLACLVLVTGCPADDPAPDDTQIADSDTGIAETTPDDTGLVDTGPDDSAMTESDTGTIEDSMSSDTRGDAGETSVEETAIAPDTTVEPVCGDGEKNRDQEACDDGNDDEYDGCTTACAFGAVFLPPAEGEVVMTELMVDPDAAFDRDGEWIELHNTTDRTLNLTGCVFSDAGNDTFTLETAGTGVLIQAGAYFVLGVNGSQLSNGQVALNFEYEGMLLENGGDLVRMTCRDLEIDQVTYDAQVWPLISGRALSLDPSRISSADNDGADSWCSAEVRYGLGDQGTPGAANPPCAALDVTVDRCVLTTSATDVAYVDAGFLATVEISEFGVTDLSDGVDGSPRIRVELGTGPPGTAPTEATWRWVSATAQDGWVGEAEDHFDGYEAVLVFDSVSAASVVAARTSGDGGQTWDSCDRGVGSEDGFELALATVLEVRPTPCLVGSCTTPPGAVCAADAVRLMGFDPSGLCLPTGDATFDCAYTETQTDCGAAGQLCTGGRCDGVVPTAGVGVVISELLVTATAPNAERAVWIEVANTTDSPVNLETCTLAINDVVAPLDATFVVAPGSFGVIGAADDTEQNAGLSVDAVVASLAFPSDAFSLALSCGGTVLDVVDYDPATWPAGPGIATALSPFRTDPDANDPSESWCLASDTYGTRHRGTPGQANPNCPGDLVPVELCGLIDVDPLTVDAGVAGDLAVRLIARSVTARTTRTDDGANVIVEVGYGITETPDATWVWTVAEADVDWLALTSQGADLAEDRYVFAGPYPPVGAWNFRARATADGGNSQVVCGDAPLDVVSEASVCDPDPCGAAFGPNCDGAVAVTESGQARCSLDVDDPTQAVCEFSATPVEDCTLFGATCSDGICSGFPRQPTTGDAVISELLIAPTVSNGELGEWIEITNPGDLPLNLGGCVLTSLPDEGWAFPETDDPMNLSFVVPPGASVTVARNGSGGTNGGSQPIAVWEGIGLAYAEDLLQLECGGVVVDTVGWSTEDGWTIPVGIPLALSGNQSSAAANDFVDAWCPAPPTPRVNNRVCAIDDVLDDCRVVAPAMTGVSVDDGLEVRGRLLDVGITEGPGSDLAIGTALQVGIGPVGAEPSGDTWQWSNAGPDALGPDLGDGYDAWLGTVVADVPGEYAIAYRARVTDAADWTYCDLDGGAFEGDNVPTVTATPSGCNPNPCTMPTGPRCLGNTLLVDVAPGVCSQGSCSYATQTFNCASYGGCTAGACIAPPRRAAAGDLVITELMQDSVVLPPDVGEWVEIQNVANDALDLRGCVLANAAGQVVSIERDVPLVLPEDQQFLLAGSGIYSQNGHIFGVDHVWDDFGLGNVTDTLTLTCNGVLIDTVQWGPGWPIANNVAMQLSSDAADATDNDGVESWCAATSNYGSGHRGSPGTANALCISP
jgi:cysteine-rich repeat protein